MPTAPRPLLIAVLAGIALVAALAGLLLALTRPDPGAWAPPVDSPPRAAEPGNGIATLVDDEWVASTAAATGIPERALAAYAGAAIVKADGMPECGLSWTTIAGIGATESDHGRHAGSGVGPDGTVTPPIYGIALDGGDTAHIPDSDDGTLDGDAEFDRAVGPFQLLPQTWRNWHTDGSGDGVEDPQNIDDAAMAAVNYLCRAVTGEGFDFTTAEGWRIGVAAYNSPDSYLATVADHANRYAEAVG